MKQNEITQWGVFDDLQVGTYFITLIDKRAGYVMKDIPIELTVKPNEALSLHMEIKKIEA